jgi:flagellar hook-associated protein 3 FlgL
MIRGLDPTDQRFLASLNSIDERLTNAERQLSSGKRMATPSDAPDEVSRALVLRAGLDRTVQIRMNLARVKTEVDTAERSLSHAVQVLDGAVALGAQAVTGTQTSDSRRILAGTVQSALEQLVAIAGTAVEGRFIFSGDADSAAPYTVDLTEPSGVSAYQGADATREVTHPSGTRFSVAHTAQAIFDAPGVSAFEGLNQLRLALESGPDPSDPNYETLFAQQTADINAALDTIRASRTNVSGELAVYGATQKRVNEALDSASKLETRQKTELGGVEDADITAAILELNTASVQRQSALSARARRPSGSLFDYLG